MIAPLARLIGPLFRWHLRVVANTQILIGQGVMYYLSREAMENTFRTIANGAAAGCFRISRGTR
jgi:hypothetical protein